MKARPNWRAFFRRRTRARAFGQTPRFLNHTEDPLCPGALHPFRSAFEGPGQEIDGGAHSDTKRHASLTIIHMNPLLLLRATERYQEQVGFGCSDPLENILVIHLL